MSYITSLARNRGTQEVARNTVKGGCTFIRRYAHSATGDCATRQQVASAGPHQPVKPADDGWSNEARVLVTRFETS
jgi:hypothetical protein